MRNSEKKKTDEKKKDFETRPNEAAANQRPPVPTNIYLVTIILVRNEVAPLNSQRRVGQRDEVAVAPRPHHEVGLLHIHHAQTA